MWDAAAGAVVLLALLLLVLGAWRVGPTFDEHFYIASGYLAWMTGELGVNLEHPPLAKYLVGLPLFFLDDVVWSERVPDLVAFPRAWFYQLNAESLDRNLFLARLPICAATALLMVAVYRTSRRLFSPRAAFFALLAFALNPNVLAHGRLATLDGALSFFLFLAVLAFAELASGFTWKRLLVAGVTFGLANLVKFTALLLVPFTLVIAGGVCLRDRSARPLGWLAGTWLVGLGVFAAGYGFEARSAEGVELTQDWLRGLTVGVFGEERPIPLLTAIEGIDYQLDHGTTGHPTYFRGEALTTADFEEGNPHPEYYLVVMLVKNPVAFLLLLVGGGLVALRPRAAWTSVRIAAFLGFPLALFALFSTGNALLGIKYVLPVMPFVALWVASAVARFPRSGAALCVVAALEGSVMLSLLTTPEPAFPNELMYYNALVSGPVGGPAVTVVGDDWGQDARTAGRFHERYAGEIEAAGGLFYDPYSRADPAAFGLERARRVVGEPEGIVAVNAVDYYRKATEYAWLGERFAHLGWSVYLFDTREGRAGKNPLDEW